MSLASAQRVDVADVLNTRASPKCMHVRRFSLPHERRVTPVIMCRKLIAKCRPGKPHRRGDDPAIASRLCDDRYAVDGEYYVAREDCELVGFCPWMSSRKAS